MQSQKQQAYMHEAIILEALKRLSEQCDGASTRDGKGFNGRDTGFGKRLAKQNRLTYRQAYSAHKMLRTYVNQLSMLGIELPPFIEEQDEEGQDDFSEPAIAEVDEAYEPAMVAEKTKLNALEVLRNGGLLSKTFPGYQERPEQLQMVEVIMRALADGKSARIQATTGTGKSLGYLIPAILEYQDLPDTIYVSTANKALQMQLLEKDLPSINENITPVSFAVFKGKGNYYCYARAEAEANEGLQAYIDDPVFKRVRDETKNPAWDGDLEKLTFQLGKVHGLVNGDGDECAASKCAYYKQCYYYKMRRKAAGAKVVVLNHALLMIDAASDGRLLPAPQSMDRKRLIIVDEAHTLEGVATDAFTIEIRPSPIYSLFKLTKMTNYTKGETKAEAMKATDDLWLEVAAIFPPDPKTLKIEIRKPITAGLTLSRRLDDLAGEMRSRKPLMSEQDEALYMRVVERLENKSAELEAMCSVDDADYVYYAERAQIKEQWYYKIARVPIEIASHLEDTLFRNNQVMTVSATMATTGKNGKQSFDFFRQQVGPDGDVHEKILPYVFDYSKSLLYIPEMPKPAYKEQERIDYETRLLMEMDRLVRASQGRTFILFTSAKSMELVLNGNKLSGRMKVEGKGEEWRADGFEILVQGEYRTPEMKRRFIDGHQRGKKMILLGLRTFWEGVDIPGEALSQVIIEKLPFIPTMDDPVLKAKMAYIEKRTKMSHFQAWDLPMMTLQLIQGLGRLVRSVNDRGVMAILDSRLLNTSYGPGVIDCLPPAPQVKDFEDVRRYFSGKAITRSANTTSVASMMKEVEALALQDPAQLAELLRRMKEGR